MIEVPTPSSKRFTIERTLAQSRAGLPEWMALVGTLPYEPKGVLHSEMLFLWATVGTYRPNRIVESGRARGQSTLALGKGFPTIPVISLERDAGSADASVAQARCAHLPHVELRFGDAFAELPRQVAPGDIVLIDGPKGWRAVELALRVLRDRRPALVFIHDCYQGLSERRFLDRCVPGAFFSDHPEFERCFAHLDAPIFEQVQRDRFECWLPHWFEDRSQASYGPTLACIPYCDGVRYDRLLSRLRWERPWHRLQRSLQRRWRR